MIAQKFVLFNYLEMIGSNDKINKMPHVISMSLYQNFPLQI
jgi:hypothetical protein